MSSNETITEYRVVRLYSGQSAPVIQSGWGKRDVALDVAAFADRSGGGYVVVQQRTVTYGPITEADRVRLAAEYGT